MLPIRNYSYSELGKDISFLLERYPFLDCRVIGRSVCGREIYCLSLGEWRQDVASTIYTAAFHGMEWITSWVLMSFIEEIFKNFSLLTPRFSLHFIPMVNPDGVEMAVAGKRWQANANGVDINHNFPAEWQAVKSAPSFSRFGGHSHCSEPETIAIMQYTRKTNPSRIFALHSQGEEIYWDFDGKGDRGYAEELAAVSGYRVANPEPLASFGGYKDWFIDEFGRAGYTIEVGKGTNPLPLSSFEDTYKKILLALKMSVNHK